MVGDDEMLIVFEGPTPLTAGRTLSLLPDNMLDVCLTLSLVRGVSCSLGLSDHDDGGSVDFTEVAESYNG